MKSVRSPRFIALTFAFIAIIGTVVYRRSPQLSLINNPVMAAHEKQRTAAVPVWQNQKAAPAAHAKVVESYGKLPMLFEANRGQTDPRVKFLSRSGGYVVFLTANEAVLKLRKTERERGGINLSSESSVLRMKLIGANRNPRISGGERLQTTSNYFIGNDQRAWRTNVLNYSRVEYKDVYPGVDLIWYGNGQQLEHDFIIAAGADPRQIKMAFTGVESMKIDGEGSLLLDVDGAQARLLKPNAWQEVGGRKREIACDYRLTKNHQIKFRLGEYDRDRPLTIDPILAYSTYIGGAGRDQALGVAVDSESAAYITGQTDSTDFPGQSPIQQSKGALTDAFVLKLNPAGNAVVYATWLGGGSDELGNEIAVDGAGNAYIAGSTSSSDFPLKGAIQNDRKGSSDAFITKLNPAGSALVYSTYLGGTASDQALGLALDAGGNTYLAGTTDSFDFPLMGAIQTAKQGSAVYSSNNAGQSWSAVANGLNVSQVSDLAIDPKTPAMIYAGAERGIFKTTDGGSSWAEIGASQINLPVNQIVIDPVNTSNIYINASAALFKSTDGGNNWTRITTISGIQMLAIDPGTPTTLYAALSSSSAFKSVDSGMTWTLLPAIRTPFGGSVQVRTIVVDPGSPMTVYAGTTAGVFKSTDGGNNWTPLFNSFPGGSQPNISKLVISRSNPATLFALVNGGGIYKTTNGGGNWSLVTQPAFVFSTPTLTIDPTNADILYLGIQNNGIYKSTDGGTTWNQINNGLNGYTIRAIVIPNSSPSTIYVGTNSGSDVFVSKINAAGSALVYSTYLGGGNIEFGMGVAVDASSNAYVTGQTQSQNFPVVGAFQPTLSGLSDAFVTRLNSAGSAIVWSTYLGGSGSDSAATIVVNPAGHAFVAGNTVSNNFPTVKAAQASNRSTVPGVPDAFITRFSTDGSKLDYSTYLGGGDFDSAAAIAIDSAGNAYVTGLTASADFPVINAAQPTRGGDPVFASSDAFATKLSADGSSFTYSTFLGGTGFDQGNAIAVDAAGSAYVTGIASSTDFPTTPNPLRPAGPNDSFITKLVISADLAISISDLPDPVMVNNQLIYTLTVTNTGPDPASGVTVANMLPAGVNFVSASSTQGNCGGSGPVNCSLGSIAPNAKAVITITVTPTAVGNITNRASVTAETPDANAANNSATQETKVSSLPSIFGRVTLGGEALGGVTMTLTGAQRPAVTTAADGSYQFAELTAGPNYTVTPSRQGYVFNPPSRTFNNLTTDQRADFAAVTCAFAIAPRSLSLPATGGMGSVTITGPDPQCPWTARSDVDWIKITSGANGNGNGAVNFTVAPTVGSRSGTITIAGNVFTVRQEFNACGSADFNLPQTIPLTGSFFDQVFPRVVVSDFNGDGKPDPAFLLSFDQKGVAVSLSNSQGGYDTPVKLLTDTDYRSIHTADLNGDGKADLVATFGSNNGGVAVLLGNGTGGFAPVASFGTGPQPAWAAISDFNGDNKPDLSVATRGLLGNSGPLDPNVSILLGNGTGAFGAAMNFSVPLPSSDPVQIEAADFTGDGKMDIAVLNGTGEMAIVPGKGDGTFDTPRRTVTGSVFGWMSLGDFDGDKKTDIAVVRRDSSELKIYLNDGAGNFGSPVVTQGFFPPSAVAANDFNGDGKSDLAVTYPDGFAVYYASVGGNFAPPVKYFTGVVIRGFSTHPLGPLATADYNRDGRPDLFIPIFLNVSNSGYPVALAIMNSTSDGGFAAPRNFTHVSRGDSGHIQLSAATGDINGDGTTDLVVAGATSLNVVLNNGRGEFAPPINYFAGQDPQFPTLRDFNGDGKLDALVANSASDGVALLLNNGSGGFTERRQINSGPNSRALGVGDFNGDGKLDLIVKSKAAGLGLLAGDGTGFFTETVSGIAKEISDPKFVVGDFNGDGKLDLAVAEFTGSSCNNAAAAFTVFTGDGAGGFSKTVTLDTPTTIEFPIAADLNGDGRADLIYSNVCSDKLGVYISLASANGSFAPPVKYDAGDDPRRVSVGDLNGDGKPDLIVANTKGGSIFGSASYLIGKGDGTFNAAVVLRTGQTPSVITAADFNDDGAADLAVIRSANATFSVFLNNAICPAAGSSVITSAASYARYRVASESIAALFGSNLASGVQIADSLPLPTTLGGVSVKVKDASSVERLSPLFFVSPGQINHLIPMGTAPGVALVTVVNGASVAALGTTLIAATSPGLFSANSSGQGVAAAVVLRVRGDGSQVFEPVSRFDATQNRFVSIPIDISNSAEQAFLILFGTGLRNNTSLGAVKLRIGGENIDVLYAGAQGGFVGLDQINVQLPQSLRGRGEVDVALTVEGKAANSVGVAIK